MLVNTTRKTKNKKMKLRKLSKMLLPTYLLVRKSFVKL